MFTIEDKIFIKKFGAGIIKSIEEKNIDGMIKKYYQIELVKDRMYILLPVDDCKKLRRIRSKEDIDRVYTILNEFEGKLPDKCIERYKLYKNTLNNDDILEYAITLKLISNKYKGSKMPGVDLKAAKEMLELLSSEISLILDSDYGTIKKKICEILKFKNYNR